MTEMTEEEKTAEAFKNKAGNFQSDIQTIAKAYGAKIIAGVYFIDEKKSGVFSYGKPNDMEALGIAKLVEQKFLQ